MSKMFASVYYTNGKNQKEKDVNEWLRNEIDGTLLSDYEAWVKLCWACTEKAAELDHKYPRTKPLNVHHNSNWGFPFHISIGDSGNITVVEVRHEIDSSEESEGYGSSTT